MASIIIIYSGIYVYTFGESGLVLWHLHLEAQKSRSVEILEIGFAICFMLS